MSAPRAVALSLHRGDGHAERYFNARIATQSLLINALKIDA
jgi:hypothetical protein